MTKTDVRDIALLLLGVFVVAIALTALAMSNWHGECEQGGGTVHYDKWNGIPHTSTCLY